MPEDNQEAPDMPSEIDKIEKYDRPDLIVRELRAKAALIDARNKGGQLQEITDDMRKMAFRLDRYLNTLPIQSPDQGAVEALLWFDEYLQITALTSREEYERRWKNVIAAKKYFKQALTRPPLDLGVTKGQLHDAFCSNPKLHTFSQRDVIGWVVDHLQATRPDLFGGKE